MSKFKELRDGTKEQDQWLSFAWGMNDVDKLSAQEQYRLADNMLALALNQIGSTLKKTKIWHTGSVEYNTWVAGRQEEMDRTFHFDENYTKKDMEKMYDIAHRRYKKHG